MRTRPVIVAGLVAVLAGACVGDGGGSDNSLAPVRLDAAAASIKAAVGVCHREGNGGFHLIDVSANALEAHVNHGDGVPGAVVPGDPSKKFDGTCALVDAAVCPCRFTVAALQDLNAEFGFLGNTYDFLSTNVVTQIFSRSDVAERAANRFVAFQAPGPDWPQSFVCLTRVYEPGFAILRNEELAVTPQEAAACVEDLGALAHVLGVPGQ